MERLRHRGDRDYGSVVDDQSVASAPAATTVNSEPIPDSPTTKLSPQQRFASAVQKVQQSKSVLTRIQSWKSNNQQPTGSVLNPDNRLFLQTQALSKSPDVPRRRIIMGHRSYTFSGDGDLIECKQDAKDTASESLAEPLLPEPPSEAIEIKRPKPPLVHKDSLLSSNTSFSEESDESEDEYKKKFTKRYSRRNLSLSNKVNNNTEQENSTIDSPESTPTPEATSTPILVKPNPINSNPVLQRHLSFDKRLSSTSLSSWESENWNPSPPIVDKSRVNNNNNNNTFSSIEELEVDRSNSCDVLSMKQIVSEDINVNNNDNGSIQNESQTSGRGSVSSDMNENVELVRKASTASTRRGSLKRQSRVSVTDEDNWREMSGDTSSAFLSSAAADLDNMPSSSFHTAPDMSGIAEEENAVPLSAASLALSRAGSAQSDSSGFQEGEAAAAAGASASTSSPPQAPEPQVVAVEQKPKEEMTPAHAQRLEQLQQKMVSVAGGLESFRAEILAESNPEKQARIQQKVDQISAVLLHLQSLCEDLQGGQTEESYS